MESPRSSNKGSDNRRRRAGGTITSLACTECRRARAKCDGEQPDPCSRCVNRQLTCSYQPHTKTQKDELIQQMNLLRAREESALRENRDYSMVFDILARHGHFDEIVNRLRRGDSVGAIVRWLSENQEFSMLYQQHSLRLENPLMAAVRRVESMFEPDGHLEEVIKKWTSVTTNGRLIRHLLDVYFTEVHTNHMLLSEVAFLNDFVAGVQGPQSHCSTALFNSICAMACMLLASDDQAETPIPDLSDRNELQQAFMTEARRHLTVERMKWLTSIQASAVIYLVELGAGRARVASSYLRLAAEQLLQEVYGEPRGKVWEASRWGILSLNTAWGAFTAQKPLDSYPQDAHIHLQLSEDASIDGMRTQSPVEDVSRPGYAILIATHYANLLRIVHRTVDLYCDNRAQITGEVVSKRLNEFHHWRNNLPVQLQLDAPSSPVRMRFDDYPELPTPAVCALHIQYFTAVVNLFLPMAHYEGFSQDMRKHIDDRILKNARAGVGILQRATSTTKRRILPTAIHCVLQLSDAIIIHSANRSEREIMVRECARILQENRKCFKISGPMLQMFRSRVKTFDLELSKDEAFGPEDQYSMDDLLEACTRLDYVPPVERIQRLICSDFEAQWHRVSVSTDESLARASSHLMRVDHVLNDA